MGVLFWDAVGPFAERLLLDLSVDVNINNIADKSELEKLTSLVFLTTLFNEL